MTFQRSLSGLLIAALAFFYALGSSGAAVACVSPGAAVSKPMTSDQPCDGDSKAHDCALACAPTCTATVPETAAVPAPLSPPIRRLAPEMRQLESHAMRPEPPPPRMGSI
jgi:hypothetical protein